MFLVCLSISVLIIYVINPPVSDAVQGAYLVGIVAPALILGGGAMVFSNLTEGLGCLLGGFCLSMWLLCLKPGGLLTNSTSIVIFICVFSAALWSTAYIKWISTYGLIFSLAFSGATAIILGIDCFSRAGLKELWVYIWRLNDDIFPLNTDSYPMTRGMKVEIAGIVIFTILGILVQWKLWGFIKKKHEARQAEKEKERRDLEREEEMIGRRVNWETAKQRERWEEVYEQAHLKSDGQVRQLSIGSGSGIGDTGTMRVDSSSTLAMGKKGLPEITVHEEAIEMSRLPSPSRSNSGVGSLNDRMSKVYYTSGGADEEVEIVTEQKLNDRKSRDIGTLAALEGGQRPGSRSARRDSTKAKRVSGSPDTPFPSLDVAMGDNPRASRGTERLSADSRGPRMLHRLSHNSTTEKRRSTSKKGLKEDDEEWENTSSIAATIDDLRSDIDYADLRSLPSGTPRASMVLDKAVLASDPDPALAAEKLDRDADTNGWFQDKQKPTASAADIFHMAGPSLSLTKDVLPPAPPRVASTYRTQEWTKRVEIAEAPAVPEIVVTPTEATFPPSPASPSSPISQTLPDRVALDSAPTKSDEAPAPVNISALQQTAITGAVAPAPHRPRSAQAHIRRKSGDQNPYRLSMQNVTTPHTPSSSRPVSQGPNGGMTRSSSYGTLAAKQQYRTSSNPLQVLEEKDDDSMSLRERQSILRKSPMPLNSHTPSPAPYRLSSQQQQMQYPAELQHLRMGPDRRQSETRMQPSPAPLPNRTSTPGYGNPHSLETMNRGVPRPQLTDLEIMEQRRLQMLEERRLAEVRKQEEKQKMERRESARVDRYRMGLRDGRGEREHREGLRRMMSGVEGKGKGA